MGSSNISQPSQGSGTRPIVAEWAGRTQCSFLHVRDTVTSYRQEPALKGDPGISRKAERFLCMSPEIVFHLPHHDRHPDTEWPNDPGPGLPINKASSRGIVATH